MKKIFLLSAIVISMIAQSCSKSTDVLTTTSFNIEEAKMSFANNFNNALSTKSSDEAYYSLAGGDYTPVWEMAKANENNNVWSLEVPIISDLQIVLRNKSTEIITVAERKLLFIKNKETHTVNSFIMVSSTAETKSSNSNFEHLAENSSYSGYVLYSTLAGEFVNLRSYNNGVEMANVNALDIKSAHHHDSDANTCSNDDCDSMINDVLGDNEYGIMLLGGNSNCEYFEGFCIWCGNPEDGELGCEDCIICGQSSCICDKYAKYCDKCGSYPCYCDEPMCHICGKPDPLCGCTGKICSECGKMETDCKCSYDKPHETLCENCGGYHAEGDCKYTCPACGQFLTNCKCK